LLPNYRIAFISGKETIFSNRVWWFEKIREV